MADPPDYWHWKSGQILPSREKKNGKWVDTTITVDEVIERRSDFVRRGVMEVDEWLDEARELWRRDHPDLDI